MKYTHPVVKQENRIVIPVDPTKIIKGHQARMTGAGSHRNKRFRRVDRRVAQERAIKES